MFTTKKHLFIHVVTHTLNKSMEAKLSTICDKS